MTTRATITASTLRNISHAEELVVALLSGGTWDHTSAAVCVDTDRGNASEDWAAVVRRDRLQGLVRETGATLDAEPTVWDGSRFGDGAGWIARHSADLGGDVWGTAVNRFALTAPT
jgi:hypothetical protein